MGVRVSKFFVVGDVTVDLMYFVDELPDAGGEVTVSRSILEPGGAGGTMATALARLGHDVKIATRLGQGPFSDMALKYVREAGVDESAIQYDPVYQTGSVTLLVTPDGQRTMISSAGASRSLDIADLDASVITDCDAVVVSAYSLIGGKQREYALGVLDIALKEGITTFIDMGSGAVNALEEELIQLVNKADFLLMNQKELFTLTGEGSISDAVANLAEAGISRVVVKVGEMGSIVVTPELNELIEGLEVEEVVNSAGAGDYYTAAFAHAIMEGYDLLEAARLGNIAGALNVTEIGAQQPPITKEQLEKEMKHFLVES